MDPAAAQALLRAAPIFGPIFLLMAGAIVWLALALREEMRARIADAQDTTKTLVAINGSVTIALTGLTSAVQALKESDGKIHTALDDVKDALPRRRS